jgi:hypothetical protein
MQVYDAIMAAADQIERYPQSFQFCATTIPHTYFNEGQSAYMGYKGCPIGCALGWIGHFIGKPKEMNEHHWSYDRVPALMGVPAPAMGYDVPFGDSDIRLFYSRMDALADGDSWHDSPALCARALRLYAAKYHAIPSSVREIFTDGAASCPTPSTIPSNPELQTTGCET